jgi:outer membrane PBP1 activator LpoA protein
MAMLGVAILVISGCSTPCGGPGRLCAPMTSITSAPVALPRVAPAPVVAAPAPVAETFAVDSPDDSANYPAYPSTPAADMPAPALAPGQTIRIGLMLPLRSPALGQAADAVRAGFMAAWERERDGIVVNVVDTGDAGQAMLNNYTTLLANNDIVVGPLARSAVGAIAASAQVSKPTIALNYPDGHGALPPLMLAMGLSIEDEARQAALWASTEQPNASALVLSAGQPWQQRVASAFAAQWQLLGLPLQRLDMGALNGYLSDAELVQLRARIQQQPPELLFVALDVDQARQLRVALGNFDDQQMMPIPMYGTSSLNPGMGRVPNGPELDGVRLLDLPWQVQRDHPAVMSYPRPIAAQGRTQNADMERLYALGIDAFRVARTIALRPASRFEIDGVTGRLAISFGQGPASFERIEQGVQYEGGTLVPQR